MKHGTAPSYVLRNHKDVRPKRLLRKLVSGQTSNVRFADLIVLIEALGFVERRVKGSHRIFVHPDLPDQLNLQPLMGDAKHYQCRRVVTLIEEYHLVLGEEGS